MPAFPGIPGIVNDGPSLSRQFIVSGSGAAIVKITVLGDDTINGQLNAGQAMGIITATGLYGQYDDAAIDGREVMRGLLLEPVDATTYEGDQEGLMVVGFCAVDESETTDVDAAGKVDVGDRFVWL